MRKLWRRFKSVLLAAIVAGIATAVWPPDKAPFVLFQPLHRLEWLGYDALFQARGIQPDKIDPRIAVVGYDKPVEDNLIDLKLAPEGWPIPRSLHARAISNLKKAGARLIVFDVVFSTPTTLAEDKALDAALKEPGAPVILACNVDRSTVQKQMSLEAPYYDDATGIDFEANAKIGFANIDPGNDGIVRTIVPTMKVLTDWIPSLAASAFLELQKSPGVPVVEAVGVRLGPLDVPRNGPDLIDPIYRQPIPSAYVNFRGGMGAFASPVTYDSLIRGDGNLSGLKDKVVFLGISGLDMAKQANDMYATAYTRLNSETVGGVQQSGPIPGVYVQAHLLNTLLTNSFITPAPTWLRFFATFLFALVGIGLSRKYLNWRGPFFLALAVAAYLASSLLLFTYDAVHLPWAVPVLFLGVTAWIIAWAERAGLKRKWAGYVSPDVLEQILRTEDEDATARRYHATIVFGDVRGFTSFSDKHDAELVIQLLNLHFERLTEIIYEEKGTIDKFLGDGILVVFGAPVSSKDSAARAVRAALRMQKVSQEPIVLDGITYNFDTGFGITTGEFVAGHVGSRRRHDFSVIGDVVNVAARLQGVTGEPDVIIDFATYEELGSRIETEPLGRVTLKGKPQPVPCFKVMGWAQSPVPAQMTVFQEQTDPDTVKKS